MWPNPKETADLVTFTEEIHNEKLYFLCSEMFSKVLNALLNLKPNLKQISNPMFTILSSNKRKIL